MFHYYYSYSQKLQQRLLLGNFAVSPWGKQLWLCRRKVASGSFLNIKSWHFAWVHSGAAAWVEPAIQS